MPVYLEIAVNVPQVNEVFHYHLPAQLEGQVLPGHLVEVPFGEQRVQGVVLRIVDRPAVSETKAILALLDPQAVLTSVQLSLAEFLADKTLSPLSACINLMLPAGLGQLADTLYALPDRETESTPGLAGPAGKHKLTPQQARLLALLKKRGALRGRQIDQVLRARWRPAAKALARRGLVVSRPVLPPPSVQPKSVRTARLASSPEVAAAELPNLGREGTKALERRQAMLRFLLREPGPVDVSWLYAESGGSLADLRYLAGRGLVDLGENEVWRDPLGGVDFVLTEPPQLTKDQQVVWEAIRAGIHASAAARRVPPYLLHGVTGSGKTEIYLRAVQEVLKLGKQAIVLVPEIALTPQTVQRFLSRFPGQVGLTHSGLSPGERYDTWRRARQGDLKVVVGPRSALFTPFPNLGLIVVDESHDDSYYQGDHQPYFHARSVALAYAHLAGAVCLAGSATPDLVSQYQARQGRWRYLHLPARILAHRQAVQAQLDRLAAQRQATSKQPALSAGLALPAGSSTSSYSYRPLEKDAQARELPPVQVVDMRQELQSGNRSVFSQSLQAELGRVLAHGHQAILFLNRRGTATYVFCRDCGYTLKCPRCDLPLIYHTHRAPDPAPDSGQPLASPPSMDKTNAHLLCHHCNYQRQMPANCPQCSGARIRQFGTGTEKLEAEVQALFPQARTLRWDYETTRQKGAHEIILNHFAAHRADVLVGTQMLAKGLDLPLVTLVGVVLADVGLNLPDYRAAERTFQVLTQVAGRAGRSPLGGQVILQTFNPHHYVIQAAAGHDFAGFYRQELDYRRRLGYPPFTRLVRLEYQHNDNQQAEAEARSMASKIQEWLAAEERRATQLVGPVPCFFARVAGRYRWQIILRGPDPATLLRGRSFGEWKIEVNPPNLL